MGSVSAFVTGLLFGLGLAVSGMTHPQTVLGFLDVAGRWNPSLLFVLGGAVGVAAAGFHALRKRDKPVFADAFIVTDATKVDRPLIVGSILFGIGWGIGGYCPGPAVALLAAPNRELWIFLPALLFGYALHWYLPGRHPGGTVTTESSSQAEPPACG